MSIITTRAVTHVIFEQWQGEIVPRTFHPGLVVLSYCVSFIGALSTLELINRRTSPKGISNHLLLFSAAVTMGGISIWSMHYLGNRAIQVLNGESELQIAYSPGFTAVSFFVPVLVLLPAFVSAGSNNAVSWWRVTIGGSLAGAAICGMHYLGNNSISNYSCQYSVANIVGSAIIAVVASNVALATFFVFRAAWTQAWWKRVVSAILLAGGVSGMHWVASTGTQYRLVKINEANNSLSRNVTAIMIICLSVGACLIIAASSIYTARMVRHYATKAKQVTLASAVFDKNGRILVTPEGLLPIETITDSFPERTPSDSLSEAHPLFHWMFQASRNWNVVSPLLRNTVAHLDCLPSHSYDTIDNEIKLVDSHGEAIEKYDIVFKEMFIVAAATLADRLKTPLMSMGVLWDHIVASGVNNVNNVNNNNNNNNNNNRRAIHKKQRTADEEKGNSARRNFNHGSLMFLVRSINSERDADNLQAAGYRFAEPHHVSSIIAASLRLKPSEVESRLRDMSRYGRDPHSLIPGVHMGFFGVRARMQSQGFEVLVRTAARNMLPSTILPLERLEPDQTNFLTRFDRMTTKAMFRMLENATGNNLTVRERAFANMLVDSLNALGRQIEPKVFDEAMLICKPADLPCNPPPVMSSPETSRASHTASGEESDVHVPPQTCQMICLRAVVPIHHQQAITHDVEFIPLNFFKLHQLMYAGSAYHLSFSRGVHRDIAPVVNAAAAFAVQRSLVENEGRRGLMVFSKKPKGAIDGDGNPVPTSLYRAKSHGGNSNRSSSTLKLWPGPEHGAGSVDSSMDHGNAGLGGIMVSQEVSVQVVEESGDVKMSLTPQSPSGLDPVPGIPLIGEASAPMVQEEASNGIEMNHMQHGGGHGGSKTVVSRGDKLGDVRTYVDDLFAICIGQR